MNRDRERENEIENRKTEQHNETGRHRVQHIRYRDTLREPTIPYLGG